MVEPSRWILKVEENPDHSKNYIQRFIDMEAEGRDLHGEARFIDAMVERNSRILDAGCGPGRVGRRLAEVGHEVVGVDVDPVLIDAAIDAHPDATWLCRDLALLDLPSDGIDEGFDVIFSAGNVMTFLAASTRRQVLANIAAHLEPGGRFVAGFQAGREYDFDDFFDDAASAGLTQEVKLSTWDLRPFTDDSEFLVAILSAG